jgi:hypothetical protein
MSRPQGRDKDEGYKHDMLSVLLREMLAVMFKDILSTRLKNYFNDVQVERDQDYLVRINYYLKAKKYFF